MEKRAQAAMEFLTTYGWALLVAIVVIGALAYFGVLSPGKFVPDSCQMTGQVSCVAMDVSSDTDDPDATRENDYKLKFSIQNNAGKVIHLTEVSALGDPESDSKNVKCVDDSGNLDADLTENVRPGATGVLQLDCGYSGSDVSGFTDTKNIERGDVVDLVVTVRYEIAASGFTASASGPVHFRAP